MAEKITELLKELSVKTEEEAKKPRYPPVEKEIEAIKQRIVYEIKFFEHNKFKNLYAYNGSYKRLEKALEELAKELSTSTLEWHFRNHPLLMVVQGGFTLKDE